MIRTPYKSALLRSGGMTAILLASTAALPALAQDGTNFREDEIIVTATRRAESIQDIPFNIAAIGSAQIEEQGFDDLSDLIAFVPGINIVDQGGRDGNRIVVRGLNADPISGGGGGAGSSGGGTVSTYLGEIPTFVDLRLNDLERVEVLLGPQGTLYGSGTLGGAVRYIPARPDVSGNSAEVRAEAYSYKNGDGISSDIGFTGNYAFNDKVAVRASVDYLDDKGFIDYPFVNRGLSQAFLGDGFVSIPDVGNIINTNPDPDFTNAADVDANLIGFEDVNTEEVLSGRAAIRVLPTDWLTADLTYYYQKADNGGRTTSGRRGPVPAGRYDAPLRVLEPSELETQLLALELEADLGFATLTSATGLAREDFLGQRDQTDLLISLEYSYENAPTFTAFTLEEERNEFFNQEARLVSNNEGPFSWIIGGFYNKNEFNGLSEEFVPEAGGPAQRPGLEYYAFGKSELVEKAVYGEAGYDITPAWNVTVGARVYGYDLETADTVEDQTTVYFPLFQDCPGGADGNPLCGLSFEDAIDAFDVAPNQDFSDELFKVNTSYKFGNGNSVYATFSQGFRIGATNGLAPCPDNFVAGDQNQCGLSIGQQFNEAGDLAEINELQFIPDTVDNYEIGAKTTWLDGNLRLNVSAFYVDWTDPQVASASVNANLPITVNAGAAESLGLELDGDWRVSENFGVRGNYSYTKAELTEGVPSLIRTIETPGFGTAFEDGEPGDRLPGSPKHQFSVFGDYTYPLENGADVKASAGYSYQGEVLSRTGGRGSSFTLPAYGRANVRLGYETDVWAAYAFVDNLFNDYSESSVVGTRLSNQAAGPNDLTVRSFRTSVLPPRSIGVRFRYSIE